MPQLREVADGLARRREGVVAHRRNARQLQVVIEQHCRQTESVRASQQLFLAVMGENYPAQALLLLEPPQRLTDLCVRSVSHDQAQARRARLFECPLHHESADLTRDRLFLTVVGRVARLQIPQRRRRGRLDGVGQLRRLEERTLAADLDQQSLALQVFRGETHGLAAHAELLRQLDLGW